MPGSRIPALTALSGAASANNDDILIFDTSTGETKRISRSQLATGLVGDLPYTPTGSISATTVPTAIDALAARIRFGTGAPEGVVSAVVGTLFLRTDGGTSTTLYVKEKGSGNTGWVAK